jgi:hypothetical protein
MATLTNNEQRITHTNARTHTGPTHLRYCFDDEVCDGDLGTSGLALLCNVCEGVGAVHREAAEDVAWHRDTDSA